MLNQHRGKLCALRVFIFMFILSFVFWISGPTLVQASDIGWTTALDDIDRLYDKFSTLKAANALEKQQIQSLNKENNDKLKEINKNVRLIDKAKLDQLKSTSDQAQQKYGPLLKEYTELGKKAAEARKRKDQKSALLYDLKRNAIKTSVNHARQEIAAKKKTLTAARKQTTAKAKVVKDTLLGVQSLKKQVTAENHSIAELNKTRTAADKRYKIAVKQGNAVAAAAELGLMVDALTQIQASQQKIYAWQQTIANTLKLAESRLPD
ncbi:colicin import membrane protein [Fontibacillus phaseoli]|uniref:Colicin import membrane protein n=1 Tax=Fontibacillus phaseoli TaxID=1416533 RepID=A0A369B1S5_9BACL|nr:hypothetical protein [Fontibacillus phaseoli]RCX15371.1 colicin import membrane protein [Fontibacillus phaseoli]